jgi:hypothetical protein
LYWGVTKESDTEVFVPTRKGVRVHRAFAAKCEVRVDGKLQQKIFAYRAHAECEIRKKAMFKLSVVRVLSVTEITEAEYDRLIKSKRFPEGLTSPADQG